MGRPSTRERNQTMTKKVKLTNARRDVIREFGAKHIASVIDRDKETKHLAAMVEGANAAIRTKYPEVDMATLRKYNLTRKDYCLKFQFPSGRVDGFNFQTDA